MGVSLRDRRADVQLCVLSATKQTVSAVKPLLWFFSVEQCSKPCTIGLQLERRCP